MIYDHKIGNPPLLLYSVMAVILLTDNLFMLTGFILLFSRGVQWFSSYKRKYAEMRMYISGTEDATRLDSLYNIFLRKFAAPALLTGFILLFCASVVHEFIRF